jgi:hypothetical protein
VVRFSVSVAVLRGPVLYLGLRAAPTGLKRDPIRLGYLHNLNNRRQFSYSYCATTKPSPLETTSRSIRLYVLLNERRKTPYLY